MFATQFGSRFVLSLCCSWVLVAAGCGGGSAATATLPGTEEERIEAHVKTLLEPAPEEPMAAQGHGMKQQMACIQLKALGPRAKAAVPALEKLNQETSNDDLKRFTNDALAAIRK